MPQMSRRDRLAVGAATLAVLAVLGVAAAGSATFQRVARAQLYADPVVHAQTSRYQEIVLTRSAPFLPLAARGRRGTAENVTSDAESHRFARKIGFKVCRSGSVSLLPPGTSVPDIPSQPASP